MLPYIRIIPVTEQGGATTGDLVSAKEVEEKLNLLIQALEEELAELRWDLS